MPTICQFYGLKITMYYRDHPPPHFHVEYAGREAVVQISPLTVYRGTLPSRAFSLVREWAAMHQKELLENWRRCANNKAPHPIAPLD